MKKYLKPILALVLVVALAIGGTLAYLTDVTEEKENKFTVKDVDIELTESDNTYTLTPDKEFTKDPTITVIKDESYVFTDVVEIIPTVALKDGNDPSAYNYDFDDYVYYEINKTCGEVYLGGGETATAWKWTKINGVNNDQDGITTNTYTYALTDMDGKLLVVSSLDKMLDESGKKVNAKYPILEGNKASVPKELTQKMIDLLPEGTVSVDLTFQGFAIQTDGLDDLTGNIEIYEAAKGSAPTTVS